MNEEVKLADDIDRYLTNEMEADEKAAFEQLLACNAELNEKVTEQAYLRNLLQGSHDRQWVKDTFATITESHTVNSDADEMAGVPKVISFKKQFWATITVAAALAMLITAAGIWSTTHVFIRQNNSGYIDLRRAIDNIQRSQNALIHDMHSAKAPANPGTYGGSGFAISPNGYVVTNYHVIHNADSIYVQDNKGNAYKAIVVYQDPLTDLAILKITDSSFLLTAPLPYSLNSASAKIGEEVFTLGYPKDNVVYGKGYISSETGFQDDTTAYQLSIPVNPGNSGGPLLDDKGNLVGIISGKQSAADDIAFAVKSSCLKAMLDSLPDDFNKSSLVNSHNAIGFSHLNRVEQIHKLENYVYLVKVYN